MVWTGVEACDDGNVDPTDGCDACALTSCGDGVVQAGEACDDGNLSDTDACLTSCIEARCGDGVVSAVEACDDGNADDTDACTRTCEPAACGDGIRQAGEACDDGNGDETDGCTAACALASCGDGVLQSGEECDDGNLDDTDACLSTCVAAACGDRVVGPGEACDDGNASDHDACTTACEAAVCGDGRVHMGVEACDDGNPDDADGCTTDCALASCGDGIVGPGEVCDDGNASEADACLNTCLASRCGDGVVEIGVEDCDDGDVDDTDGCLSTCEAAVCGDGVVRTATEACDDGNLSDTDGCRNDCALATCGDGTLQTGELCDDGNLSDTDDCLTTCVPASCGDGVVHASSEACDDGNSDDSDDCAACTLTFCGDGLLGVGELCDDGNLADDDACLTSCVPASCGDGVIRTGFEACDDGNASDHDACTTLCQAARCGDGLRQVGVEACDDANDVQTDACLTSCEAASCGDGIVWTGQELCDDANHDNTDGCLEICDTFDFCDAFAIAAIDPPVACEGATPAQLTLDADGLGFLTVDGADPLITFDGVPVTIAARSGCEPVYGVGVDAVGCDEVVIEIPPGPAQGDHLVAIDQPLTATCEDLAIFSVGPIPTVSGASPTEVCEADELALAISGTGLLGSTVVQLVSREDGTVYPALSTSVTGSGVDASFDPLEPGDYDLEVSNGSGCESSLPDALTVLPRPIVFFVDPPVVYNALDFTARLFLANLNGGSASDAAIRRVGDTAFQSVPFAVDGDGRVLVTFPADQVAAGEQATYEVQVTDAKGCTTSLNGQAVLTKQVSGESFSLNPPFAGVLEATATVVVMDDLTPAEPFEPLPRVYVVPSSGAGAAPLGAVGLTSGAELTGRIPAGLAPDLYTVVVVNPGGEVFVDPDGLLVTASSPPLIDTISPGSVPTAGSSVQVTGSNFPADADVELTCQDSTAPGAGSFTVIDASPTITSYGLDFVVPAGVPNFHVCIVRVVDPTTTTYDEFSSLVVLNSAENLPGSLDDGQDLFRPRRGAVSAVGEVTRTASYLYAIGGDLGSTASAMESIEISALSRFGALSPWRDAAEDLPEPRTLASLMVLERFLYLVGGHDGSGPVDSVLRAEILRPEDAPTISDDLDVALDPAGLGPGTWYYQVSAVMDGGDADNPDGETLPSEPLPVVVPAWAPDGFVLTLRWDPLPGADSYRIYRSPVADSLVTELELLDVVSGGTEELEDDGLATSAGSPRQLGDLGAWHEVERLEEPRSALGLGIATDPLDEDVRYLYAVAGHDGGGNLATYESIRIDLLPDGTQVVGPPFLDAANPLPIARSEHLAFTVDAAATTLVALDETWIYAGPGNGATKINAAEVLSGGLLDPWIQSTNRTVRRAGYAGTAASNQLFFFGGADGGVPSDDRDSGGLQASGSLANINSTGGSMTLTRSYSATGLGMGRIYILGGATGSGVTGTVESSVW